MIDKKELYSAINTGMLEERHAAFAKNLEKNMVFIKRHGGLKGIINFFNGRHVVIAGAGPSLEKSFEYLKKSRPARDYILVATDMSFLPLMRNKIRPDYVFSCETNPLDFFGSINTEGIHLAAFSCMSNINLRKWRGSISFYNWMIYGEYYDLLWDRAGADLGFLATGGIVTTQALSFALGCSTASIMLIGNDLAFSHRYYVSGSAASDIFFRRINRLNPVQSQDKSFVRKKRDFEILRGEKKFFTTAQFLAAKTWIEELVSEKKAILFDGSEPGCSDKYVSKKDFALYIREISAHSVKRGRRI